MRDSLQEYPLQQISSHKKSLAVQKQQGFLCKSGTVYEVTTPTIVQQQFGNVHWDLLQCIYGQFGRPFPN